MIDLGRETSDNSELLSASGALLSNSCYLPLPEEALWMLSAGPLTDCEWKF